MILLVVRYQIRRWPQTWTKSHKNYVFYIIIYKPWLLLNVFSLSNFLKDHSFKFQDVFFVLQMTSFQISPQATVLTFTPHKNISCKPVNVSKSPFETW